MTISLPKSLITRPEQIGRLNNTCDRMTAQQAYRKLHRSFVFSRQPASGRRTLKGFLQIGDILRKPLTIIVAVVG
jgi:hypothetical protein